MSVLREELNRSALFNPTCHRSANLIVFPILFTPNGNSIKNYLALLQASLFFNNEFEKKY